MIRTAILSTKAGDIRAAVTTDLDFVWGTVVSLTPVTVLIDGDTVGTVTNDVLGQVGVGDRVRCEWSGSRLIVHGAADRGVRSAQVTSVSLASGAWDHTKTITLPQRAELAYVVTNAPAYVRLYKDAASRTADASRAVDVLPVETTGVCYECVTATGALRQVEPSPIPIFNDDGTTTYPIDICRVSGTTGPLTVTVGVFS